MTKTVLIALSVAALLACKNNAPDAPAPSPDAPITCATDADCSVGACGPCSTNAPITSGSKMAECAVNPCPGKSAMCSPSHTCVVK